GTPPPTTNLRYLATESASHKTPPRKREMTMAEKTEFVQRIHAAAVELEGSTGVPAAVTTAQAILESGFGGNITKDITTGVSSNNLFGIKAVRKEKYVTDWTHEIVDGKSVRVLGKFKAYSSEAESLRDHAEFLARNPRYKSLFSSSDPVQWA